MKNHVIHARVDQDTLSEIQSLKKNLGLQNTTEVISLALHRLFAEQQKKAPQKSPFELMEEMGLVGFLEDSSIDSSRESLKRSMMKTLESKLDDRRGPHV